MEISGLRVEDQRATGGAVLAVAWGARRMRVDQKPPGWQVTQAPGDLGAWGRAPEPRTWRNGQRLGRGRMWLEWPSPSVKLPVRPAAHEGQRGCGGRLWSLLAGAVLSQLRSMSSPGCTCLESTESCSPLDTRGAWCVRWEQARPCYFGGLKGTRHEDPAFPLTPRQKHFLGPP